MRCRRLSEDRRHPAASGGSGRPSADRLGRPPAADRRSELAERGRPPRRRARRAAVEVNSLTGMLRAVQSGLGLAALPDYMGRELEGLLQVLPELKAPRLDAYFVYPEEMRHSKRVSVFRDFLVAELSGTV
ncbi:LysR substrate-binding domain-containing protein [Siccirubricoccus deserti]